MKNINFGSILNSASKIVLLMIAITICAALFSGQISEDTFKVFAMGVFTYYFTRDKGEAKQELATSDN